MMSKTIKIIIVTILIGFVALSFYQVNAATLEIDPENYITMPTVINVSNNVGTATVSLASAASGYTISYQKVDTTEEKIKQIDAKGKEIEEFLKTATESDVEQAQQLQQQYMTLIPNYGSSWTETTNTKDNIKIDFKNFTGTAHFILWVKITNGTNTYYDCGYYSTTVTSTGTGAGSSNEGGNGAGTTTGAWSSAKVQAVQSSDPKQWLLTVSGVVPENNHSYYYYIGEGSTEPEFSSTSNNWENLKYDQAQKVLKGGKIEQYLEIAAKRYVWVYDYYLDENTKWISKKVIDKVELKKPEQKKYTDVFCATYLSGGDNAKTQILFNTPWSDSTVRKIHLKIGKINDDTILKNIKDKKSSAFEGLLQYAKKTNGFYDNTLNSNATNLTAGGINMNGQALFAASNITNGEYYFLYAVVDSENGKYVQTEGITLARAQKTSTTPNDYLLDFYGSDNFTWKTFSGEDDKTGTGNTTGNTVGNTSGNTTKTTITKLPYAGQGAVLAVVIVAVIAGGVIAYKKYEKYNF